MKENARELRLKALMELIKEEPSEPFHKYALGLEYREIEPEKAYDIWENLAVEMPDYLPVYYPLAELLGAMMLYGIAIYYCDLGIDVATAQSNTKTLAELKNLKMNLEMELL